MRMLLLALATTPLIIPSGCGGDDCSSDSDCPTGRICRLGLCALDVGGDTVIPDGVDVTLDCEPAGMGDLVMNEILADPGGVDVDGNGTASASGDEFVELVNVSTRSIALTNVVLAVGDGRVEVNGFCLDPNQARVVFGSAGLPGLTNSGSTVSLLVDDQVVQSHTYGSEGGNDTSLTLAAQLDTTSGWVRHDSIAATAFSPGTCSNGNDFPNCEGGGIVEGDTTDGETIEPLCSTVPVAGDMVINEILADPTDLDANQDDKFSPSDDEFVELVNSSGETLQLDGMTLGDSGGPGFTFPFNSCVAPGGAVVVFKKYEGTGDFGGSLVLGGASYVLNNDEDIVNLSTAEGTILASHTYGSEANDDQSITRAVDGDAEEAFVKHSAAPLSGGSLMSPGFCQSGAMFPNCGGGNAEEMEGDTTDASDTDDDADVADTSPDDTHPIDTTPACGPAAAAGDLVINEIAVNPGAGSSAIDFNLDGAGNSGDEFVELVSVATNALDLTGVTIADAVGVKYTFGSVCLNAGEAVVVFGGGGISNLSETGAQFFLAGTPGGTSSALQLNNTGETVTIGSAAGSPIATQPGGSGVGTSSTRNPDVTGAFVLHSGVSTTSGPASPGTCVEGGAFPGCVSTP